MTKKTQAISSGFPYKSRYVSVLDGSIHYIDEGQGNPVVFLHGMPTSCYLWRNIIPSLTDQARCIAPDLIGMGKSSKVNINYDIHDQIAYVEGFIDALALDNITFVLHGWGSVIGLDYAMRHPDKVKAVAFSESHVRPIMQWDMLSLPVQQLATMLKSKDSSYRAIIENNYLVNKVLPSSMLRQLTDEEMDYYRAPFQTPEDRKPLWQYLQELPLGEGSSDVLKIVKRYSARLQQSAMPKLLLYSVPGFILTMDTVKWCKEQLPNLTIIELGQALHFAQESIPAAFSDALRNWYSANVRL